MKLNDKLTFSNNDTSVEDLICKESPFDHERQKLILQMEYENGNLVEDIKIKENIKSETFQHISLVENNATKTEMSIDDLLNKIGFNQYHYIIYLIVILSLISDGAEIYLIYLIAPIIRHINNYSDNFVPMITSILFFGMALGCISSGLITKYFGRKNGIMLFLILITVFGIFCVSINNIYWFILCRFIVGISIGYLFNIVNALCEILPIKYRDFLIGSIFLGSRIGIAYFVFVFYIFSIYYDILSSYKTIVIISSFPMIICLIIALIYFEESPRILLWDCQYAKAFDIIEKMNKGSSYNFNDEDKNKIVRYIENSLEKEYSNLIKEREKDNNNQTFNYMHNIYDDSSTYEINKTNKDRIKKNEISIYDCQQAKIINDDNKELSLEEKKKLILENKKSWKNFFLIFQNKKLPLTLLVCSLWMINCLSTYTNLNSLPIILANQNKTIEKIIEEKTLFNNLNKTTISNNSYDQHISNPKNLTLKNDKEHHINSESLLFNGTDKINQLLISNLIPLPAEILAGYFVTHEVFEKKTVIFVGFFFVCIFSILMPIFPEFFFLFSSGINFFLVFSFNITKLYTSLAYHTDNRDFAYGLANFSSRIIAMIVPFLVDFLLNINLYSTCYLMLICNFIGCVLSLMLNENLCKKPIK